MDYEGKQAKTAAGLASLGFLLVLAAPAESQGPTRAIRPAAASTWATLTKAGLVGTWALSCVDPAGPANWIVTFYSPDGVSARLRTDRGPPDGPAATAIDVASLVSPTSVEVRLRYDDPRWGSLNGQANDIVYDVGNRRMQVRDAKTVGGEIWARDGKNFATGKPSQVLERCGD